ncbi:hypothetical protein INS49_004396 [Diaporthe citri]|uniref:uncharacterized protein n=1 Tax=Diaporthe citri TaxID=83186 RepID=UPI001C7FCAC6|nr:uncharacterized protein INS49_004396 [Diaporthe citri]KAG6354379.1 hypothetical protein INS49_004396 [Diaporthe citri]
MAHTLGYHRRVMNNKEDEAACHRTFWVIYLLEKCATFIYGMTSLISDHDVGCPIIPPQEEHLKDDFEKFVFSLRLGRIFSRAYESLFSVSASLNSIDQYELKIDAIKSEAETWRRSIPAGYRPGSPFSGARMAEGCLRLHYCYHALSIALGRLDLYVGRKAAKTEAHGARMRAAENELMESARAVARLTICIDIRPHTPLWILASCPLSAMFVLFDMVIHKPSHPETEINLALLDTVVGYFGRFDYATAGSIPCGLFSGFSHIANQFVRDQWQSVAPAAEESELQSRTQASQGIDFAIRCTYFACSLALFSLWRDFPEN